MDGPGISTGAIGRFEADALPAAAGFAAFRRAALDPAGTDCRFGHAPDRLVDVVPHGLIEGVTVFGEGMPAIAALRDNPVHRLAGVSSVLLNDAVLAPDSMAVIDSHRRFFGPSVDNLAVWNHHLPTVDRAFVDVAGGWSLREQVDDSADDAVIALPVGGVGSVNYGHFLYDGLPAVLLHRQLLGPRAVVVGRPLLGWQAEVLDGLGLLGGYRAIERPTRFRKLVTSTMVSWTVSYPNRFVRAAFDHLRFRFGGGSDQGNRLIIVRDEPGNRRVMVNRAEILAIAAAFGFEPVRPAGLSVAAQVRRFAGARCVIGESGAGLANLGFCDPGAKVLEIQPACFSDGWTRAACHLLGLRWQVFFATCRTQPDHAAAGAFEYWVDPLAFRTALARVFGAP
ncbi:glycosyltransferase family 61 protein [Acidiphilium sp. PA]|uniref:glycosyltransferase family 61 protein n=1 Tax=Acidiphilium sp. PA TaxID=2871705 RepID=UPI002244B73F|nr:glycosyltransferase 61 family protein [Acidiphilium sp. PA]MCW8307149.1 glycosyltransferase family 61 protein [Acidiphilium sp. PA]